MAASAIEQAALSYLARGWSVITVAPRSKRPNVRWEEFQHRQPTEQELRSWLARRPDANVGIVTGAVSGIVVLDVDPRHGGRASLERWERTHGRLPDTLEARTGGGGRHLYFAHPGGELRNRVGLAPGLDLRGDGGVIVAPPSVHPSGRRYRWLPGRAPDQLPLVPLPAWLLEIARGEARGSGPQLRDWRGRVREAVPEGQRNDAIADPAVARELLVCWNRVHCRPPLADDEVRRTVQSIARTHFRHHGGSAS
jgi:hypothetical protein